jgi:hypothetical protein
MDPLRSPRTSRSDTGQAVLAGHDQHPAATRTLLAQVQQDQRTKNLLTAGRRGVGKASLLAVVEGMSERAALQTVLTEITRTGGPYRALRSTRSVGASGARRTGPAKPSDPPDCHRAQGAGGMRGSAIPRSE